VLSGDAIGETSAHGNIETLARVEVEHGQRPELPAIGELVSDEVHAPDDAAGINAASLFKTSRASRRTFDIGGSRSTTDDGRES